MLSALKNMEALRRLYETDTPVHTHSRGGRSRDGRQSTVICAGNSWH